jgi:hypothetical protein
VRVFFKGSPSNAILSMLDISSERLSRAELDKLERISKELKRGKKP